MTTRSLQPAPKVQTSSSSGVLLHRKCACGSTPAFGEECNQCRRKKEAPRLQRLSVGAPYTDEAPPIVHDVLRSAGQPLDASIRSQLEPQFGRDFSRVRVHTDATANASARAVNAAAYTVGNHIAFASGNYAPSSTPGRSLLAHELTHVVQQGGSSMPQGVPLLVGSSNSEYEVAAERMSRQTETAALTGDGMTSVQSSAAIPQGVVQRQTASTTVPGEGLQPPGVCAQATYERFRNAVFAECKGSGAPRSCRGITDLSEIEKRIEQNARCIAARRALMFACFRGGDQRHRDELQREVEVLMECHEQRERVRRRFRIPEPSPEVRRVGVSALIGAGVFSVLGAIVGAFGGAAGGTLVAPGVGTVGGGVAGGVAGAAKGATIGAAAGAAVGAAGQALVEWLSN